jgi:hypothetical protein
MISTNFKMVELFFDRPAVANAINKAERKALSKIGAFIRRRARSSLRFRKRVSLPGETPSVHSRDKVASLKTILFAFQPATHSVLIGPVGLNQVNNTGDGSKTVPEIHEFGGAVTIREEQFRFTANRDRWFRRDARQRSSDDKRYRTRRAEYAARPFMGPALEAEAAAGTIPEAYAGTVEA